MYTQPKPQCFQYQSIFDKSMTISSSTPVLTIFHTEGSIKKSRNSFLIEERVNSFGKLIFIKYELKADDINPKQGRLDITEPVTIQFNNREQVCNILIAPMDRDLTWYKRSWDLRSSTSQKLYKMACQDKEQSIFDYQERKESTVNFSTSISSYGNTYDSTRWVHEKLSNLNDPIVTFPESFKKEEHFEFDCYQGNTNRTCLVM